MVVLELTIKNFFENFALRIAVWNFIIKLINLVLRTN